MSRAEARSAGGRRPSVDTSKAVSLTGPAGSLTIHNCRMLHASKPNRSVLGRPLLLNVYAAADALPYTYSPRSKYMETIVRGERARWAHHDPPTRLVRGLHFHLRPPAKEGLGK